MTNAAKTVESMKDMEADHASYPDAMKLRDDLHNAFSDADYRRGYVSMDESPGKDFKPISTWRCSYSNADRVRAEINQTFEDNDGKGKTTLTFEKPRKSDKDAPVIG